MSLIVAVKDGDHVVVGAESRVSMAWTRKYDGFAKAFKPADHTDMIWGVTGTVRSANILKTKSEWISKDEQFLINGNQKKYDEVYITSNIIPAMFRLFNNQDYIHEKEGIKNFPHSKFLLIYKDTISQIGSDGSVITGFDYWAIGCAEDLALGSLEQTVGQPAEERIRMAIKAAVKHDVGINDDVTILSTKED